MNYDEFYRRLFAPVEAKLGRMDADTITSIVGFDAGGPISLRTVGYSHRRNRKSLVTYISCELAMRADQKPSSVGRYELMTRCDDENWARRVITKAGEMTLDEGFDHGHSLDIGVVVGRRDPIQAVIFERFASVRIDAALIDQRNGFQEFGLFWLHGITRPELAWAQDNGTLELLERLRRVGTYPGGSIHRKSIRL